MKKGLALCGGGSLGVYELGAWEAFRELGMDFDILTGTSIGALNSALYVQQDFNKASELWKSMNMEKVMNKAFDIAEFNLKSIIKHEDFKTFLASYVKGFGGDIKPFKALISEYLDCDKIRNSNKTFGVVVTTFPKGKKKEIVINDLSDENMYNYILATASCFPVFPTCKIDGKQYIDGGYVDNLPINFNFDLGADKVVAVDLKPILTHKEYSNHPNVEYIYPKWDLGSFLYFDPNHLERNKMLGYFDVLKHYNKYDGFRYTFNKTKSLNKLSNKLLKELTEDLIYFQNNKKKSYIKKEGCSNVFDYLNLHIKGKPTSYDYFLKCIEEVAFTANVSPKKVYDIEEFIEIVLIEIEKNKDYTVGEKYVLLENDAKRREFIKDIDKKTFTNFLRSVKLDYNFRMLLLQSNVELYLSLVIITLLKKNK
ncbi:MAG: patatin-like phospholipase family protein [bacterium]